MWRKWHILIALVVLGPSEISAGHVSSRLPKVADDLSILARIVKGIAIGETLSKEPSKLDSLVGEVFNLGQGVTMNTLANGKIGGLDTDLGAIGMAVEKECGGQNGCGDVSGMVQGVKVLEEIGRRVEEVEKVLDEKSPLARAAALKTHFQALDTRVVVDKLSANIRNIDTTTHGPKTMIFLNDLRRDTDAILEAGEHLASVQSIVSKLQQKSVIDDITIMNRLGDIPSFYSAKQEDVNRIATGLNDLKKKLGVLKPLMSQEKVGEINGKLDELRELIRNQTDVSGVFELDEISRDVRSTFVRDTLGKGRNVEESLEELLNPADEFRERLTPLRMSWNAMKQDARAGDVDLLQNELKSAQKEVEKAVLAAIVSFPSAETCFGNVNLGMPLNTDAWIDIAASFKNLDTLIGQYKQQVTGKQLDLSKLTNFRKKLDEEENSDAHLDKLKAIPKKTELIAELESLKKMLDLVKSSKLYTELKPASRILDDALSWMNNSGLQSAVNCLKAHPAITSSALSSVSFSSLLNMKSDSHFVKPIVSMSSAFKTSLGEWNKMKSSQIATKSKRAAKKTLQNAEKLSKELSEGVEIIRNLAEVQKKQSEVQKLVAAEAAISTAVSAVKDPTKKAHIDKIWNGAMKQALKQLPGTVDKLEKSIEKRPETISDYEKVFASAKSLSYPNINTKDLGSALDTITDPPGIQSTLHSVATLDLQFVDTEKRLTAASGALAPLLKFFDEVFAEDGEVNAQKQSAAAAVAVNSACSSNFDVILGLSVGFVASLLIIGGLVFLLYKIKHTGGDKKTDKKTDKKKTSKEKDLETGKGTGKSKEKIKKSGESASLSASAPTIANPSASATPATSNESVAPAQRAPNAPAQNRRRARSAPVQNAQNRPAARVASARNSRRNRNQRAAHVALNMEDMAPVPERGVAQENAPREPSRRNARAPSQRRRNGNEEQRRNGNEEQRRNENEEQRRNGNEEQRRNENEEQRRNGNEEERRNGNEEERRNGNEEERRNGNEEERRNGNEEERRNGNEEQMIVREEPRPARVMPARREEYWEDQNDDDTLGCVADIT